ncbi:MAG: LysR family transcriptional regulator [Symbiopectobacterium sp.]
MDKFQAMNTFVAVVEAGSFVGAIIDTVALSKPVVSRHVVELEEYLGVRLLQRTTRRLSLTEDSQNYYLRCRELLASIKEAESEITAYSAEVHGRLRVGAPQTFGVKYLTPLWGKFVEENPQVKLDIILSDRVVDLVEEGYDVVIRIAQLPNSMFVCRPLAKTRMVLCTSPAYLAQHGTPQHPLARSSRYLLQLLGTYSYWAPGNEWHFSPKVMNGTSLPKMAVRLSP